MDEQTHGSDEEAGTAAGASSDGTGTAGDEQSVTFGGQSDVNDEQGPMRTSMRYSRRRLLVLGGAFVAGLVAVIAGLRAFGGSAATKVSDALSDQFGPFPVRSIEAVPDVPVDQWQIKVDGLVDQPLTVDRTAWTSLTRIEETVDFHCVEGWTVDNVRWGGVAPSVLLERAGVRPEASWVVVHAESGQYLSSLPLDLMRDPTTLLADTLGGKPLPPEHGGPLRLVVPVQLGYKNVKWVSRLEVTDKARAGYWEQRGYPEGAPIPGG